MALMGAGLIGREHAALVAEHPGASLAAIADPDPAAVALAATLGVRHFDDYECMLDEVAPDGVIVALPNTLHVEAGLACITRQISVLVEKPVAETVTAAMRLVEAGEEAGVPVLVGHQRRHGSDIREAKAAISRGDLGRIVAINGVAAVAKHDTYFDVAWRRSPGGGPLLINAIHDIDCFRFLGGEIETVQAIGSSAIRGHAVEDTVAVALRFASGAVGTYLLTDASPSPYFWEIAAEQSLTFPHQAEDCYVVFGRKASLAVPTLDLWEHEAGGDWRDPLVRRRLSAPVQSCYVAQLENLIDVIHGTADPVVSGREGAMTLAATLAVARAITEGRPVDVAELLA
ncbi:MAG: Gfo/Idh/MocA family oxidoreductase [Thermoleophilia bacterium]|nr:Gfo/Idh/MocA family oxidoreductase [Thermoleophilia bacterium]